MTTANDNGANTTGEQPSPVATASRQVVSGLRCIGAIEDHPEAAGSLMRMAAKYFSAAAERLRGEGERRG